MGYEIGERDERPWGTWEVLGVGAGHAVKRIVVRPGMRLSLQRHSHRAERWVVVSGAGQVTKGEQIVPVGAGDVVAIEVGELHRIANTGTGELTFVEVQLGDRLEEADIERVADDHGRV